MYKSFDRSQDIYNVIPADEPDFIKGYTPEGFQYLIKRNPYSGSLLGYVRVPRNHPWIAKLSTKRRVKGNPNGWTKREKKTHIKRGDYNKLMYVDVHGGLTYSGKMYLKGYALRGIWVGFDCAHYCDNLPVDEWSSGTYRDVAFVKRNIDLLSSQMVAQ